MYKLVKKRDYRPSLSFDDSSEAYLFDTENFVQYSAFFLPESGNFGDRIIPKLGLRLLTSVMEEQISVRLSHVREGEAPVYASSTPAPKALIIGPGGLICGRPEETPSKKYSWFVNLTGAEARELTDKGTKLFFWGTGVNLWGGKRLFTDEAKSTLTEVFEEVELAFIRGTADISFLKSFLPEPLHHKLVFQPCPSFFIKNFAPPAKIFRKKEKIAINIAADQLVEAFGLTPEKYQDWESQKHNYYRSAAREVQLLIKGSTELGLEPVLLCSTKQDTSFAEQFLSDISRIDLHKISSTFVDVEWILSSFKYAIGMRLHAWIPFLSLGIPSVFCTPFSIRESMPRDLGFENLICSAQPLNAEKLIAKVEYLIENHDHITGQIELRREELFELSLRNARELVSRINLGSN